MREAKNSAGWVKVFVGEANAARLQPAIRYEEIQLTGKSHKVQMVSELGKS